MCNKVKFITAERIIAATAVGALFFAAWQGREMRRHNRLSVKPRLTSRTVLAHEATTWGLFISNEGLGPAIIQRCDVYVDNELVKDNSGGWQSALAKVGFSGGWIRLRIFATDSMSIIGPGDSVGLLVVDKQNQTEERWKKFVELLSHISIRISYVSAYDEKFEIRTKRIEVQPRNAPDKQ